MADVLTVQPDRVRVGLQACWEIEALCEAAREVAGKVASVSDGDQATLQRYALQLRGLTCRIEELNTATMSVLDGDDETRHIERKVLGFVTA
ncbi:hypothetical protein [Roseateles sp.]|uniref:hypothetical protein n=1 Tax=Roseateles sp. TaxID=1971397 RepID=UPI00393948E8